MEHIWGEHWQTFETLKKPLLHQDLDFAVRENVKLKIQNLILAHMEAFVENGLTFEKLKKFQQELGLCPSLLEAFPHENGLNAFQKFFQQFF